MGLFHFEPEEGGIFRKIFLNLYAKFEISYLWLNYMIVKHAYPSQFWRRVFLPVVYTNALLMLRYGQHGKVMTVEEVKEFLNKKEDLTIAIGSCRCRMAAPEACDCETEADITIMSGAEIYKSHFPEDYRFISKDEAIQRVKRLNEEGLIPMAYSFCMCGGAMHEFVICNCCKHACVPILVQKIAKLHTFDPGKYMAQVNQDACEGCGECVETCQMDARSLKKGVAQVDQVACVGCGACERICPEEVSELVPRTKEVLEKQLRPLTSFHPT